MSHRSHGRVMYALKRDRGIFHVFFFYLVFILPGRKTLRLGVVRGVGVSGGVTAVRVMF